jgi:aryl-alcohol dehydrogenase-like predicted oxidoreductase
MEIVNQAEKFAEENNVNMTVIATVWVIQKGCFPIVGINSERFAEDIVEAFKVKFTDKIFKNLEELYLPRPFIG